MLNVSRLTSACLKFRCLKKHVRFNVTAFIHRFFLSFFFKHLRTNIQIKQSERFTVSACSFHLGFGCAIQILETSLQTKNTAENNTDDKNLIVCISFKEGGEEKGGLSLIQGLIYKQPLASQQ